MNEPLSPRAQAVLDACNQTFDQCGTTAQGLAAALEAVADQVVPQCRMPLWAGCWGEATWTAQQDTRADLLAIADELRAGG